MPKFHILYKSNPDNYHNKQLADCRALSLAIGYYFPDAEVYFDQVRKPYNQLIVGETIPKHKLLWFKYVLQKPLLLPKTNKFKLIYLGVKEHNDMLTLCNTDLFTSCSYGLEYNANALKRHTSRHPIGLEKLNLAYSETESVLITSPKPISNQLAEAVAFNTKVVFTKSSHNVPWLTARISEDVKHIVAREDEQEKLRTDVLRTLEEVRLKKDELQKMWA